MIAAKFLDLGTSEMMGRVPNGGDMSARQLRARSGRGVTLCCLLLLATGALNAQVAPPRPSPPDSTARTGGITGVITGTVRDETGAPLIGAMITVDGGVREARSAEGGRFVIDSVRAGSRELIVRHIGFRPIRTQVEVRADSAIVLAVTIVREGQRLPGVVIEEQIFNQLGGIVVDELLRPVPGAVIDLVGIRRQTVSDAEGRFIFVDIPAGNYILEVRAPGYALARRGVEMVARIERDLAIRLHSGADARISAELAEVVAKEADRRRSFAGARAIFVSRAELEKWGDAPLLDALRGSSAATAIREVGPPAMGRGQTSFSRTAGGAGRTPSSCVLIDGHEAALTNVLSFFRASEVELVEVYPVGTENSRTLCGRFPPSSGCSCPPEPAGVVVWLVK